MITTYNNRSKLLTRILAAMYVVMLLLPLGSVLAISRGYATDDTGLKTGMVVRLSPNTDTNKPKVERASSEDPNQILGVTTTIDNSIVTIASGEKQVYIESTGEVDAYVTNLSGDVKKGDLLTISALKGILTKSGDTSQVIVAIALEDFSSKTPESYEIDTNTGKKTVELVSLHVTLDRRATPEQSNPESSLKRLGRSLVGKEVNEIRIIIALIIFFIVVVSSGGILYGAVTTSITAFGRNPLAKTIIRKELVRVIATALAVLSIGLAAVYAILWI